MPRHFDTTFDVVKELKPSYPVYCLRPNILRETAQRFVEMFPGDVLYAVKCNPHPEVMRYLHEGGVRHFDTASPEEISIVRRQFPGMKAYFMHPVKSRDAIRNAYRVFGIDHYVIDTVEELEKIREETEGDTNLVIHVRLATPPAGATYNLSAKFGARPMVAAELLKKVDEYGYHAGLCFHVGSQCTTPTGYRIAVELIRQVVDFSGVKVKHIDVGGGFPGQYMNQRGASLEEFMDEIKDCIRWLDMPDTTYMCEPGRALVSSGISLITQVHLRKEDTLFINDGVYGSLSETVTGQLRYPVRPLRIEGDFDPEETMDFTIYGPTCDNMDVLPATVTLPADIREGDWIEFGHIGAYSNALATHFNGFHPEVQVTVGEAFPYVDGEFPSVALD
ncbi:type III PLP-dependent enzyme [Thalassospira sp. HF15]|uniref:type III PLP-dependent enzyme n=1 Tax=Thalassospira sp. HF15 TaxID=2722755 RepID=UPI001431DDBB|nr:type III PLP-dependent enzyme [Thalassospira sp. HF15]